LIALRGGAGRKDNGYEKNIFQQFKPLIFTRYTSQGIIFKSTMISKTHIKYIQSLQHKKFRDTENVFIAEGSKVVMELLQSVRNKCTELFGTEAWMHENEAQVRKYYKGALQVINDFELEKISALSTASNVLAVFEKPIPHAVTVKGKISILLDDIQDPGNLGTIIRIADWYAVEHIICSAHTADMYNPKVVQSTMGSLLRVNVLYTDLPQWLRQNNTVKIYAAALHGKNITELNGIKEGILIIGNESKGISDELMNFAHEKITIPKLGSAESLNAAVATGIILSHIIT
jgi:TrmH family RNA methyltransferase